MALKKFKQIANDPVIKAAPKAEHGYPIFGHLNVLVAELNAKDARIAALEATVTALDARITVLEP